MSMNLFDLLDVAKYVASSVAQSRSIPQPSTVAFARAVIPHL
jgi:hypothetical protein